MGEDRKTKKLIIFPGESDYDNKSNQAKPISMRGRSLSFSAPIHREPFSSQPESPAAKFLSEFSHRDDFYDAPEFEEGTVIHNYLIGQTLGGGAYSECREAYVLNYKDLNNSNIPDKVALKIITDPRYLATFRREIEIWSRLRHPYILPLIDNFSGDGYVVAVSILAENGNLHSYISKNGKLDESLALRWFKQLVSSTHYLHEIEKIVHLDIKLENILLRKNGDIYLCDFGMSGGEGLPIFEDLLDAFDGNEQFCSGSVTYLPPEVFSSSNSSLKFGGDDSSFEIKKKQDIWALGVTLYAMVAGRLPFSDEFLPRLQHSIVSGSYRPLPEDISFEIKLLVSSLLTKIPENRPSIKQIMESPWLCK